MMCNLPGLGNEFADKVGNIAKTVAKSVFHVDDEVIVSQESAIKIHFAKTGSRYF